MPAISHAIDAATFEFAFGNKTQIARAGVEWAGSRIDLHDWPGAPDASLRLSIARWRVRRHLDMPDLTQSITDVGLTPILRFESTRFRRLYAEAGIGIHYLSQPYDGSGRLLSTHFQFGPQLGIGYVLNRNIDLRLLLEHVSNGGIRKPNNGVNFAALSVTHRF